MLENKIPDFQSLEYSSFSPEQINQLRELYSGSPVKINEEGLSRSLEAEMKNARLGLELPRYNYNGTRRQGRGFYSLELPKFCKK